MKTTATILVSVVCLFFVVSHHVGEQATGDDVTIQPGWEMDVRAQNEERDAMIYGPVKENGARNLAWRSSKLGENVEVEGLALGGTTHFDRVVYDGSKMFVRTANLKDREAVGRLVRVKGILRYEGSTLTRLRTKDGTFKSGKSQPYFFIEASSVEVIDQVKNPRLVSQDL